MSDEKATETAADEAPAVQRDAPAEAAPVPTAEPEAASSAETNSDSATTEAAPVPVAETATPEAPVAAEPMPDAAAAPAPDAVAAPDAVTAPDAAEDGDAAEDAAPDAQAAEGAPAEGEPAKKKRRRRRRRRKKKPEGEGATAEGAEATAEANGEASGEANGEANGEGAAEPATDGDAAARASTPEPSRSRSRADRPKKKPKGKPPEKPAFNLGDEVFGRVTGINRHVIIIEVAGGKAVGLYDREQLITVPPLVGQQFIAKVKGFSTRGGMLMLGPEPFDLANARAEMRAALQEEKPIACFVTGIIKGGLEVDYKGIRAFAPASHVDLKPNADLTPLLGEKLEFAVSHYGKKGRDIVLSRKQMLESAYKEKRAEQLAKLSPEMKVKAMVRTALNWGVFVSLPEYDDIEGVIHMSEASHDRGARLERLFKPGQEIEVQVLEIDDKGKLWVSAKACIQDPWAAAVEKYKPGSILTGKVVRLTDFGAFIQLEPGIDGLCHVADLSFSEIAHPKDAVEVGQDVEVVVANLDSKAKKVTLHPAPPAAEREVPRIKRLANYQKVECVVMQHHEAGLGVRILGVTGRHARGFIPAGQSGTPRGTDLRKTFPLGQQLQAKIIDLGRGQARLSIRALKDDAEKQAYREYRKQVQREATFGTFGDLLKGKL